MGNTNVRPKVVGLSPAQMDRIKNVSTEIEKNRESAIQLLRDKQQFSVDDLISMANAIVNGINDFKQAHLQNQPNPNVREFRRIASILVIPSTYAMGGPIGGTIATTAIAVTNAYMERRDTIQEKFYTDTLELNQSLLNLIQNEIKYRRHSSCFSAKCCLFAVIGIPAAAIALGWGASQILGASGQPNMRPI